MKRAVIAGLLAAATLPAFADVVIDFQEIAPGTVLTDQYQSMYGINFYGSVVQQSPTGYNYVAGGKMTFAPQGDFRLTFNAVGPNVFDPSDTWVKGTYDGQAFQEPIHVGGVDAWKDCGSCTKYHYGSMWDAIHSYSFNAHDGIEISEVDFNTSFLANIHITSSTWDARMVAADLRHETDLPEPASLGLLAIGAVMLARQVSASR